MRKGVSNVATATRRQFVKGAVLGGAAAGMFGAAAAFAEGADGSVAPVMGSYGMISDEAQGYQAIFDVVSVGSGCAGMCAALEAAQAGLKACVIEAKPNYYEANSSVCAGLVWGWHTHVQEANGIPSQTMEDKVAYMDACSGGNQSVEMRDILINEADENFEWLKSLGVEMPDDGLVLFGAEDIYADVVPAIPHSHYNARRTGRGFTDVIFQNCVDAGVEFIWNCTATSLVVDPDGRIVGVVTDKGAFRGNKGIVMATAGFSRSKKLIANFMPGLAGSCAGSHNTGDGIIMGASAGAQITHMWCLQGGSIGTLTESGLCYDNLVATLGLPDIEVDPNGDRIYPEDNYYEVKYAFIVDNVDDKFIWNIWDQATTDLGAATCFAPPCSDNFDAEVAAGLIYRADTIEGIAEQIGLDPDKLAATLARYNEMAEAGVDEDFGRVNNLTPLVTPPFYCAKGVPATSDTAGGLAVNGKAEVIDWNDEPIPGFYAAGSTTGGWHGDIYQGCGVSIAMACIMGRHAGINAAAEEGSAYEGNLAADAGAYLAEETVDDVELGEGQYLGIGQGMGGDVRVVGTVSDGAVTDVEVVYENETKGVGSRAVEQLPAAIVEAGTWDVDAVGGATVTSDAIKAAVEDAMEQAGL